MIYFRAHIQALESQIAFLKERLEKAEQERREVEQEKRKAEEAARVREDALLDRLLTKNNVAPVAEPLVSAPPVEMMTPYAGMGPDMQEAYKESWIKEEAAWIMSEDSAIDEGTARVYAEQNYVTRHQLIK